MNELFDRWGKQKGALFTCGRIRRAELLSDHLTFPRRSYGLTRYQLGVRRRSPEYNTLESAGIIPNAKANASAASGLSVLRDAIWRFGFHLETTVRMSFLATTGELCKQLLSGLVTVVLPTILPLLIARATAYLKRVPSSLFARSL